MDCDRISIRTADRDHRFLATTRCFLFDFVYQALCAVQSDPSLDSHSFENFLDHCLACRRSLYCCHWFCLFSTGRSAFFLVLYRLLCGFCISGHDIQIITQTVHVFLCAVVCSEFHTDSCQITLRSPCNCPCDIQFC